MMLANRHLHHAVSRFMRSMSSWTVRHANPRNSTQSIFRPVLAGVLRPRYCPSFSTSIWSRQSESQVNDELLAKIESELSVEKEMRDPEAFPAHLKEYIENSPFEIHDTPGKEEVVMTRTFGDEQIKISFSIDDLNNVEEEHDTLEDDASFADEMDDLGNSSKHNQARDSSGKTSASLRGAAGDQVPAGDRQGAIDEEEVQDETEVEPEPSFPSHCLITVERPNKGALQIEAIAQDGLMIIENVYYYKDGKLADPKSRSDEEAARDLYTGPPFGNLDEDLQLLFERYLEERGINTTLALFVPEYIDFKEQREYLNWLSGIRNFVE